MHLSFISEIQILFLFVLNINIVEKAKFLFARHLRRQQFLVSLVFSIDHIMEM